MRIKHPMSTVLCISTTEAQKLGRKNGQGKMLFYTCSQIRLRLLDTYASKIAKICDLKTFWPLI